ncbi:biopolymer transporter ExbD [Leptotrichia sp. OH3620_COT-345]|uniref:ExbD/TolR family protein n=1 Tax=Leptotrichia sp. OH3620_COT-345 TaxID=2491048 RepID=UPI000F648106|nr:biopolymer transporter ExbD [Leptotrichia sp. OH3620_COT-345]RRD40422.1 biopolymer transporter ExbD [Leptotrichia sp. OH3620_COT-345]
MRFVNRRSKRNAEISMLNLIDVIFMLLIFFMITTTFNKYTQFKMTVPKTDTEFNNKKETAVELIVNRNQNYFLKVDNNIKNINVENIKEEFSRINPNLLENVILTADEHLEYGVIVGIMGRLKNQNVKNINLNIQKNNK